MNVLKNEKAVEALVLLKDEKVRAILELLKKKEASPSEISSELGIPFSTVSRKLSQLKALGLVAFKWDISGERPFKVFSINPTVVWVQRTVFPEIELDNENLRFKFLGKEVAEVRKKTKVYCCVDGVPILLEGDEALLALELSEKREASLKDILNMRAFKKRKKSAKSAILSLWKKGLLELVTIATRKAHF